MNHCKQASSFFLSCCIVLATCAESFAQTSDQQAPETPVVSAKPSAEELQQLVAPIALYPDALVAQVLAASTYPDQIVEADRWLQAHPEAKGDQLAQTVDQQQWDPSVKALTEFPSVLANMDKNLSWTSSLGDAYINDQQNVMNAVQAMRQSAKQAGHLQSSSEVKVNQQAQTIIIEPADPQVVYVPEFDPWLAYGVPVAPWPGWYWYPGLYWTSPAIAFGAGFGVGFFSGYGWGWPRWEPDWHHHTIIFNHDRYVSRSRTVVHRSYYANRAGNDFNRRGPGAVRGANAFRSGPSGARTPQHSFAGPGTHNSPAAHGSAFGGFNHGGVVKGYSSRGFSSMGRGGFGGGFHGAGGSQGGHR